MGHMARKVGIFYVPAEPKLAFVVRGISGVSPKLNKASINMLRIAEPHIAWGSLCASSSTNVATARSGNSTLPSQTTLSVLSVRAAAGGPGFGVPSLTIPNCLPLPAPSHPHTCRTLRYRFVTEVQGRHSSSVPFWPPVPQLSHPHYSNSQDTYI
uniref:Uncharacterized protein n=1 Tax=Haplochromis burtoni TaxID=8153 RepID=A0A3Q2WGB4_HAPBU